MYKSHKGEVLMLSLMASYSALIFNPIQDIWINIAGAPSKDAGNYVEES